ncbi:MAG: radical SAM protein [Sandaracinaceae bacterium]|nr:radical SAM protein [Sandaracinaceae bacterium]
MNAPYRLKKSAAELVAALRADPHAPFSAMVEIADRCNETCAHCYQIQGEKGELETDEWKSVFDELAQMGVLFLTISGGEATLRKDFLELVAHARAKRFAVKLYTNGLTMTRELAVSLAELAVQEVQISLYSHRPEMHDWVTKVPGSWEKTVAGVRHLVELGVAVVVKTPLMTINADAIDEYLAFVQSLGAHYSIDPNLDPREDGDRESQRLAVDEATKARALAHPLLARPRPAPGATRELARSVCGACSGSVHIEADGEMRPCTLLGVAVGHAVRDGVRQAWARTEQGAAIRQLTWADLHGCRDCDLQPYCSRCFANARTEGGDALGPYESACRRAAVRYEAAIGEPVRSTRAIGPFRLQGTELVPVDDVITELDRKRAAQLEWARGPRSREPGDPVVPGQLVQLRRPGARKARGESVPSGRGR